MQYQSPHWVCLLMLLIRQLMIQVINGTKLVFLCLFTLPTAEILSGKNGRAWVSMVLYFEKEMKIKILKRKKKSLEPFRSCLLNSTTNSAQFWWKWDGLTVLFKGQLISKGVLMSSISSKKRTKEFDFTTMIPQIDMFSFVFWRKSKTPKNHFEII